MCVLLFVVLKDIVTSIQLVMPGVANQLGEMGNCTCGGQYKYFREKIIIVKSYMKY